MYFVAPHLALPGPHPLFWFCWLLAKLFFSAHMRAGLREHRMISMIEGTTYTARRMRYLLPQRLRCVFFLVLGTIVTNRTLSCVASLADLWGQISGALPLLDLVSHATSLAHPGFCFPMCCPFLLLI